MFTIIHQRIDRLNIYHLTAAASAQIMFLIKTIIFIWLRVLALWCDSAIGKIYRSARTILQQAHALLYVHIKNFHKQLARVKTVHLSL